MSGILDEYISKHPGSAQRYAAAVRLLPGGVTHDVRYAQPFPLFMTHGQGPLKWDVDGNEYVDYVSGHGALLLGHSYPAITEAVSHQVMLGTHLGANTDAELRWAKAITALLALGREGAVSQFGDRGHADGHAACPRLYRQVEDHKAPGPLPRLARLRHGRVRPCSPGNSRSQLGKHGDCPCREPERRGNKPLANDQDIAGLILEPTGAHFGQLPFDPEDYLLGLRELTEQHEAALIFDEVVTGFRASPGGSQVRYSVSPDLTTMAKIVAGGLPGGAVGGRAEIMDMMTHRGDPDWDANRRLYHPGTFNGNPLSAAAGATCLELIADHPINRQADAMAGRLKQGLNDIFGRMEVAGHAHGIASMIHVVMADCDCDRETCSMPHSKIKETTASPAVTSLKRGLQNQGVDIMGRGSFLVSAVHGEEHIDRTLEAFQDTLQALRAEGLAQAAGRGLGLTGG